MLQEEVAVMTSSVVDTEVFIPEKACVLTVPLHSLPSSMTKKMVSCPLTSDLPATFISPVELRKKGMTQKSRPLTPGQFFLPVVTSNRKAFMILRNFLHSGDSSLQAPDDVSPEVSLSYRKKNSIVICNTHIYLIIRKNKVSDWPLGQQGSAPSACEALPLISPQKTQDGGSDVTEGWSKDGENGQNGEKHHGSGGEMMNCEGQDDDITNRKRNEDVPGAAKDHGKCSEVLKEREANALNNREENKPLMKDAMTSTASVKDESEYVNTAEESDANAPVNEAPRLLIDTEECKGGEIQVPSNLTENSDQELTSEQGCDNEISLSSLTHTGNEKRSDNLKPDDDLANDPVNNPVNNPAATGENVLHKHDSDITCTGSKLNDGDSSVTKSKCCKQLIFPIVQSASLMNIDRNQVSQKNATDVKEGENCKGDVRIQMSESQSSCCGIVIENVDVIVNDEDPVYNIISDDENAAGLRRNRVENLLEKVESLKRRINDCIISQGSPVQIKKLKRDDMAESAADYDDLIIVESCAEVVSGTTGSDAEVSEVIEVDGSSIDEPNRHTSDHKCHIRKTANSFTNRTLSSKGASSSEAKRSESAAHIIVVDNDKPENDVNRDMTACNSVTDVKLRAYPSAKHCTSALEIVDLVDDDDDDVIINDREVTDVQMADVVKGDKRKISQRITDDTNSAVDQICDAEVSALKRSKRNGVNFSSERERMEGDDKSDSWVKNDKHDVEIIKVDDDDDDQIHSRTNDGNEKDGHVKRCCSDETKGQRNVEDSPDGIISDVSIEIGDDVKSQSLLEKNKCCKHSNSSESHNWVLTSETEGSDKVTNEVQSLVEADDLNHQVNDTHVSKANINAGGSLLVKDALVTTPGDDQILCESEQVPNRGSANSKNTENTTINQTSADFQNSTDKNKMSKTANIHNKDSDSDANKIKMNVKSCSKSHISEFQIKGPAETEESTEQGEQASASQICGILSDHIYVKNIYTMKPGDVPCNVQANNLAVMDENVLHNQDCIGTASLMNVNGHQDKCDIKGQISELFIPSGEMKTSEIVNDNRVLQKNAADLKEVENCTCDVRIETSECQSLRCESTNEIIDVSVNDDDPRSAGISNNDQSCDITNDTIYSKSHDSKDQTEPDDQASDKPKPDVKTHACESHADDLALASSVDKTNPNVISSNDCCEPQNEQPEPTNQSAREFDYMELRREENISLIRARLRGIEEKLHSD